MSDFNAFKSEFAQLVIKYENGNDNIINVHKKVYDLISSSGRYGTPYECMDMYILAYPDPLIPIKITQLPFNVNRKNIKLDACDEKQKKIELEFKALLIQYRNDPGTDVEKQKKAMEYLIDNRKYTPTECLQMYINTFKF